MDVDYEANKNNYFANHIYKGLKLKNKEDEIKMLKMLNEYDKHIRKQMDAKENT